MVRQRRTVGLIAFLKGNTDPAVGMPGCANYDHYYGGCLLQSAEGKQSSGMHDAEKSKCPCLVEQKKRCRYFEQSVLPTAADIGLKELVYSLYEKQVGIAGIGQLDSGEIRKCPDCGAELKPRQRYCDDCARKRRVAAYRKSRLNKRSKRNT
jgi:hypothetical protein